MSDLPRTEPADDVVVQADAGRQLRNSFIYLIPVGVGNLLPLLTLPFLTRVLTPSDYGAWALATAYGAVATGIANFGLTVGYERNFFENTSRRAAAALLYSTVSFVVGMFLLVGGVTWVFRDWLALHIIGSAEQALLLFLAFCSTAMLSLKVYFLTFLKNRAEAKAYVWYTVDESIISALLMLVLVVGFRVGVVGLVIGPLVASTIVLAALLWRFTRDLPPRFSGQLLLGALSISYPLTPRIFIGAVGNNFDRYLVRVLGSVAGAGVYAIGQRVAMTVFAFMTALHNVYSPQVLGRMFRGGEQGPQLIGRYLTPFAFFSIGVALVVALFSEEAVAVLAPPDYHGAIPIITLLSIHFALLFFGKQPQLLFAKKTFVITLLSSVGVALNIGLNLLFIPHYGAVGAALGTLTAGVISGAMFLLVSQRFYRIEFEFSKLAAMYGVLVVGAGATFLMRELDVTYEFRLAFKLVAVLCFAILGAKFEILSRRQVNPVLTALGMRPVVRGSGAQ